MPSRTVFKLTRIIGQIFALYRGRGYLSLTHLFGDEAPNSRLRNFSIKKLETAIYQYQSVIGIWNCLGVDHECDGQTDGQADMSTRGSMTRAKS